MVGHMQSVSEPKYRLAAVAEDSRVRVFAEPYLVDTITELFNLTAKHGYVILVDEAGGYKVVDIHHLSWAISPVWPDAIPGKIAVEEVENSQGFDTLDQAVVYLSSELNGAEVMYFTTKQSAYIVTKVTSDMWKRCADGGIFKRFLRYCQLYSSDEKESVK